MEPARSICFGSDLSDAVVLQADVVLDCGATETAGGVEAAQILVDVGDAGICGFSRPTLNPFW